MKAGSKGSNELFTQEELDFTKGYALLAGLDEAGRGPLAGPVSAGCVVLPSDFPLDILNDSKKISEKKREAAEALIKEKACWGFGLASNKEIDELNILNASLLAMKRAFFSMKDMLPAWLEKQGLDSNLSENKNILALVDGLYVPPKLCCEARAFVKADGKFPCVMAASIIAKVGRDRLMVKYDELYPGYGYAKHKGYPTEAHFEACRKLGPSPIQRMCFAKDKTSKKDR